jgi:hypothetical protein
LAGAGEPGSWAVERIQIKYYNNKQSGKNQGLTKTMHPINILFPLWIISISTMVIAIMTIVIASRRRPKLPKCELSLDEFITLTNSIKPKIAH